jgi:hypothetical protein
MLSLAGSLCVHLSSAHGQIGAEYNCTPGQCLEATTHITNTPWSGSGTIELGWYQLTDGTRRLGFCKNGVKTFAQSALGFIPVNSAGSPSTDISLCGGSGIERLHTWHSEWSEQTFLQCGTGTSTSNRLRPIKLDHKIVVSTLGGTSSDISLWLDATTSNPDVGVQFCGGSGNDWFQTNKPSYMTGGNGDDYMESTSSGWFGGQDGDDEIVLSEGHAGLTVCHGGTGDRDTCSWCDYDLESECEDNYPF